MALIITTMVVGGDEAAGRDGEGSVRGACRGVLPSNTKENKTRYLVKQLDISH